MAFTPLGDALQHKMHANKPLKKQLEASQVIDVASHVFQELFGEDGAKHIIPQFLKNRTLTVTCASSVVAQEIRLNQMTIVEKINEKLGKNDVDRIRYLA